jgi:hypothetical protein
MDMCILYKTHVYFFYVSSNLFLKYKIYKKYLKPLILGTEHSFGVNFIIDFISSQANQIRLD